MEGGLRWPALRQLIPQWIRGTSSRPAPLEFHVILPVEMGDNWDNFLVEFEEQMLARNLNALDSRAWGALSSGPAFHAYLAYSRRKLEAMSDELRGELDRCRPQFVRAGAPAAAPGVYESLQKQLLQLDEFVRLTSRAMLPPEADRALASRWGDPLPATVADAAGRDAAAGRARRWRLLVAARQAHAIGLYRSMRACLRSWHFLFRSRALAPSASVLRYEREIPCLPSAGIYASFMIAAGALVGNTMGSMMLDFAGFKDASVKSLWISVLGVPFFLRWFRRICVTSMNGIGLGRAALVLPVPRGRRRYCPNFAAVHVQPLLEAVMQRSAGAMAVGSEAWCRAMRAQAVAFSTEPWSFVRLANVWSAAAGGAGWQGQGQGRREGPLQGPRTPPPALLEGFSGLTTSSAA